MITYGAEPDNAGLRVEDLAALREQLDERRLFRLRRLTRSTPAAVYGMRGARDLPARVQVHIELTVSARIVLAEKETETGKWKHRAVQVW